jgi:large subunit ribosomal protein L1
MLDKNDFTKALQKLKETSPKRKFAQAVDLILNLKELDLKKPEEQLDIWVQLPNGRGKPMKFCALVGPELKEQAKANCDTVILHDEFKQYEGKKKEIKKLARKHDLFIAQATIMPDVARYFGRVLGPRGKMPNPKAGCVVPPNANLKALTERLKNVIHVVAKIQLSAKCAIGKEDFDEAKLLENALTVYNSARQALPQEDNNIKSVLLKYSMGAPVKVGASDEESPKKGKKAEVKEAPKAEAPAAEKPKKAAKPKTSKKTEVKAQAGEAA